MQGTKIYIFKLTVIVTKLHHRAVLTTLEKKSWKDIKRTTKGDKE